MNIVRYILGVVLGFFLGGIVNVSILGFMGKLIPPPEGVDPRNFESVVAGMPRFELKHFIAPFLAHALGTFVSAFIAAAIVPRHKSKFALAMGILGLIGGITAVFLIPAPLWYDAVDLIFAYIPTAWIAAKIAGALTSEKSA